MSNLSYIFKQLLYYNFLPQVLQILLSRFEAYIPHSLVCFIVGGSKIPFGSWNIFLALRFVLDKD